jgi:dihydrofolate reductase
VLIMRRLVVNEFLSVDGVMQAPGAADEDTDGGFAHGGWQIPYNDDAVLAHAQEGMAETDAYVFGRRTYEIFAAYWPTAPAEIPFTDHLNHTKKYVASRTLNEVEWQNSELLRGDVAEAVAELKAQPGGTISILGSGNLVQTLLDHDLVDELGLIISPIVLGSGKRLFRDADHVRRLEFVRSIGTPKGNVIASYQPLPRSDDGVADATQD